MDGKDFPRTRRISKVAASVRWLLVSMLIGVL